jgi:hypothetical protein
MVLPRPAITILEMPHPREYRDDGINGSDIFVT